MMMTRARLSRRNKVTVQWLPVELIIEIFRRVQKLIGRQKFSEGAYRSMKLDQEYNDNLLAFASSSKEWTAIAQAELFRNIILKNRSKTGQFLKLVREKEQFKSPAESAVSIRFGGEAPPVFDMTGLDDDLDEIALYCPNVVEISCYDVRVRLSDLQMKKLDKLNVALGSIQLPSTSEAPLQPFILPITLLSLYSVTIPSPLDPSSLPLVRSLHLSNQAHQPIQLLLPQLDSLNIHGVLFILTVAGIFIQESTSITFLSLHELTIAKLDDASKTVIKDQIVELRLRISGNGIISDSTVAAIIAGSKVMKKVILDAFYLSVAAQVGPTPLETLKVVKEACKKKKIELWRENFDVGNGKVDLEK